MSQSRPKWNLNIFKHLHFGKGVKKKICCHQSWLCLFYFQWNFHEICARFQLCWGRNKWHGDGPITPQRPLQEWHVLFHEAKCLSNEATPLLLCCPTVVPCEHVGQKPNGWWFEITQVPFDKTPLIHCLNIITLISLKILSKSPLRSNDEPFSLSVQFTVQFILVGSSFAVSHFRKEALIWMVKLTHLHGQIHSLICHIS